jgi:transposase InsO family protein
MKTEFDVNMMCRLLKVGRSGFYEWSVKGDPPTDTTEEDLKGRVLRIFRESRCTYGIRSIRKALGKEGVHVGVKRTRRLMRIMGLFAKPVLPNPYAALGAAKDPLVCKHRLKRNFQVKRPDRVWTGDITYIWTHIGWVYLAVVIDLFSRKVVGWALSQSPDTDLVICALAQAVRRRPYRRWRIMFHSDQGCQYTAQKFREFLRDRGILQSMSRRGQCWDNAPTESFFGTLKYETGLGKWSLENMDEVEAALFDWIETWYNTKRLHSSLDYCSPVEFEIMAAA